MKDHKITIIKPVHTPLFDRMIQDDLCPRDDKGRFCKRKKNRFHGWEHDSLKKNRYKG